MRNKEKSTVSIELHDDFIKICEVVTSRRREVRRLIKKVFSSKDDKIISQEIKELFETGLISEKHVFLNMPRHLVMSRILHLPSVDAREIRDMVKIEAETKMPHLTEDIIIRYKVLQRLKDGYSDVLVVMVQKGTIDRLLDILKNASLNLERIALSAESLFFWYSMVNVEAKKDKDLSIALLNIDSSYIDMEIIEKGRLVFTRAFPSLKKDLSGRENLAKEIKKSILIYQKERNKDVEKVVVTGAYGRFADLEPILDKELGIPLEFVEQERNIQIEKKIDVDINDVSFVGLLGLSNKFEEFEIDLLPEEIMEKGRSELFKKDLLKTGVLSACLIFTLFGSITKNMYDKTQKIAYLDSEISAVAAQAKEAENIREYLKVVKNEIIKRPLAIDIVAEIYKITPEGISFNLLDYEINRSLLIKGNASSLNSVVTFISILEDSPYFENVKIKYTRNRHLGNKNETDFELTCSLSNLE